MTTMEPPVAFNGTALRRTGKRLPEKRTEVSVHFKPMPHAIFQSGGREPHRNVLAFRLQPREGIVRTFAAKYPVPELSIRPVRMDFCYSDTFQVSEPPRAYAWLLLDVMHGDPTLFARSDWIRAAWSVVDPIAEHWEEGRSDVCPDYAAGSWGPDEADALLARENRQWEFVLRPGLRCGS